MTRSVGVHEAKTQLSKLLARVASGEEVDITKRGRVVARLVAPMGAGPRQFGMDTGRLRVADDFDAELPADVLSAFDA